MANSHDGVILISGGMDSVTLLHWLKHEYDGINLHALNMYYGQRHKKEQKYCKYWCKKLEVPYTEYKLNFYNDIIKGVSAMVGNSDLTPPDKEYDPTETPVTYAPFRNALFTIISAAYCESNNLKNVYTAIHFGDAASNYWDCSKEYLDKINNLLAMRGITLNAPFVDMKKADIARTAKTLPGFKLEKTWSCYKGGEVHCGTCSTCRERILAAKEAGLIDHTVYAENPYKSE